MSDKAAFKIAVVVPCGEMVAADFAYHLGQTMGFTGFTLIADRVADVGLFMQKGTYIDTARDTLARTALDWGATHIFWLDSDMIVPKDAIIRLMNRNEPIVGANYSKRMPPVEPTAIKTIATHERCYTLDDSAGLEAVETLGFGCVLTRRDVFEALALKHGVAEPFFLCSENGRFIGEDAYFCKRAMAAGFTPKVDHDLSHMIGHVGSFVYLNSHAAAARPEPAPPAPKIEVVSA